MQKATQAELIETLEQLIAALEAGAVPQSSERLHKAFYCFSPEALAGDPDIKPGDLDTILARLGKDDIPTLAAALAAAKAGEQAWLGFKVVTDPAVVLDSTDSSGWNFNGPGQGSADIYPGVFFANAAKEVVFARPLSPRDLRQAKDVTSGPHMHNRQYAGVAWTSVALEPTGRVVMLGCGDVSVELEKIALLCGFDTIAVDDDAEYLTAARFPGSQRILLDSFSDTAQLDALELGAHDFICVVTRGHMHDSEGIIWAAQTAAGYIGMMGNPMKNANVYEQAIAHGIAPELLDAERLHAPIGLPLGGKAPAELAVSIAAEIIKVNTERRKGRS